VKLKRRAVRGRKRRPGEVWVQLVFVNDGTPVLYFEDDATAADRAFVQRWLDAVYRRRLPSFRLDPAALAADVARRIARKVTLVDHRPV
jgi:hypothetical protein